MIEYKNEAFTDFSQEGNRQQMEAALAKVAAEKGAYYPLIIDGEEVNTEARITSLNPSLTSEVVGTVARANTDLAEKAVQVAARTFESWKQVAPQVRASLLFKAAAILRRRKFGFSAWLTGEAG